jgi:hypothetical protein
VTQANPIIGSGKTGLEYRNGDNDGKRALLNHHKGSSAPSYAEAGTLWLDDSATPWKLKMHDGADWIVLLAVNASGNAATPYLGTSPLALANFAADTGAANAYAVAPVPALAAYTAGQLVPLRPAHANTGASTLAVSGLSAVAVKMPDGSALPAGALTAAGAFLLFYDGTNFVLMNPAASAESAYWAADEQLSGAAPAAATVGAWTKRTLTVEKRNAVTGASLSSGAVTLPAGIYDAEAALAVYNASASQGCSAMARLYDATNGVTLVSGMGTGIGLLTGVVSAARGSFTLAGAASVELQYFCQATGSPRLGYATANGDQEAWAFATFTRKT